VPRAVRRIAVGVDGCPGGWVVASRRGARVVGTFAEVLAAAPGVAAVDMPIGLPTSWSRTCDVAARHYLSPRGSTIFPTPPRALLACLTYADASVRSRSLFGKGITMQTFHLLPKIREMDAVMSPDAEHEVAEAHPECSFLALSGELMPPKRTPQGRAARLAALRPLFGDVELRLPGARPDDVLDAYVLAWTAERFARGEHLVHGDGERDERGLLMRIVT
jgi:predicted RNase H-like nuclease